MGVWVGSTWLPFFLLCQISLCQEIFSPTIESSIFIKSRKTGSTSQLLLQGLFSQNTFSSKNENYPKFHHLSLVIILELKVFNLCLNLWFHSKFRHHVRPYNWIEYHLKITPFVQKIIWSQLWVRTTALSTQKFIVLKSFYF